MGGDAGLQTGAASNSAAVHAAANGLSAPPDTHTAEVSIQDTAGFSAPAGEPARQAPPGQALPAQLGYPLQAPGYYFATPPPGQPAPAGYPQGQPPPGQPMPVQYPPGQPPPGQPMPVQYPPGQPPPGQPMFVPYQPGLVAMPQGPPVYMVAPQPLYGQPPPPMYVQTAAPMYIQQFSRNVGYEEGTCACGGDLGTAHWTIVAWLLCFFFCPFNFCIPECMPMERNCKQCGRTYEKPY